MLNVELDEVNGIATLRPNGALSEKDFEAASSVIDPYIEKYGNLKGIVINTKNFPGWESFGSLILKKSVELGVIIGSVRISGAKPWYYPLKSFTQRVMQKSALKNAKSAH